MASLVGLLRIPELVLIILDHLDGHPAALSSLLRTCKSFFHICYPRLWSTLRLNPSPEGHGSTLGRHQSRKRCRILEELINTCGVDVLGFKHTRRLEISVADFACDDVSVSKFGRRFGEMIGQGHLDLRHVEVFLTVKGMPPRPEPAVPALLLGLKRYSESKSAQDFSITLNTQIVGRLPHFFDLEKVAKLDIRFRRDDQANTLTATTGAERSIADLTNVLTKTVNLRYFKFSLDSFRDHFPVPIENISYALGNLQSAITNLRSLQKLVLKDHLFHPSFFVIPPGNVKVLVINALTSICWWEQFVGCPLTGVEDLTIGQSSLLNASAICPPSDGDNWRTTKFQIEDVAITGLKRFLVKEYCVPDGLTNAVLRRNKGIRKEDLETIAEQQIEKLFKKHADDIGSRAAICADIIADDYLQRSVENPNRQEVVDDYVHLFRDKEKFRLHASEWYPLESGLQKNRGERVARSLIGLLTVELVNIVFKMTFLRKPAPEVVALKLKYKGKLLEGIEVADAEIISEWEQIIVDNFYPLPSSYLTCQMEL
ncbi:hypothetical protein TWF281_000764 [Arthrobotrys megalospora]